MQQHEAFVGTWVVNRIKLGDKLFDMVGQIDAVRPESIVVHWADGRFGEMYWNYAVKANAYALQLVEEVRLTK